jgi:DNA-binding LytR/AlgR family response regulator
VFLAGSTAALALVFFDRLQTAQVQTTEANARIVELSELLHGVNPAKTQGGFLTEIWVPKRGGSRRLLVQDVVSLTAERDYVRLRAIDGSDHLVRATLHGLHAQLDPTRFVQVHRSAIVNIGHITAADRRSTRGWTITLANGAQVPVGRNHTETLKQLMRADNGSKRTDTETRDRP